MARHIRLTRVLMYEVLDEEGNVLLCTTDQEEAVEACEWEVGVKREANRQHYLG